MAEQVPDDRALLEGIDLSFAEAALLCEALRALWLSPKFIERTWREMRDIIRTERLEEKLGHDRGCYCDAFRWTAARRGNCSTADRNTFLGTA